MVVLLSISPRLRAQENLPTVDPPSEVASYPETWPVDVQAMPGGQWSDELREVPTSAPQHYPGPTSDSEFEHAAEWPFIWPQPQWFGLRHSSTHGRNVDRGEPFVGTSWRNRPLYVGAHIGPMWFTESLDDEISTDVDVFGGIFAGWDADHYWGHELRFDWATPEFRNSEARDADRADSLFAWNFSFLYYPWGDAKFRPYWRAGIGNTHIDYPIADDDRHHEWLLTFPLGIGVKYPVRRWLAARAELTDYLSLDDDLPTQHNVALTIGLEWRFGAHPSSYWPWHPGRHIW
jgi:hypothetical protein